MQLRPEDAVLCPQELDRVALLVFQPAEQRPGEQVQRNHARNLRHRLTAPILGHYAVAVWWCAGRVRRLEPRVLRGVRTGMRVSVETLAGQPGGVGVLNASQLEPDHDLVKNN